MADTLTGVTETSAAALANISEAAQMYLQQEAMLLPTITDYSYLVVPGTSSVKLPRGAGFTVADKSENTAADATAITYAADTITLENHRYVQFLIEDIADIHTKLNVVRENTMRAVKDMARDIDQYIVAELKKASASAPDHQIVFIDDSTDVIAKGDILAARALLQAQYLNPRECFIGIGPEKENQLLAIDDFIHVEKWGSATLQTGVIGSIYGQKVIVHNDFADFMCVWHPSAVGGAFSKAVSFDSQKDLANLGMRYSLDCIHGFEILDSGKRSVLIDSTNA